MPVKIPSTLPAAKVLAKENIFVMDETRASAQDIRPLKIIIVNLMPTKQVTETQLLRLLGNNPIQIEIIFLRMASHVSKNTSQKYLDTFYRTFDDIKDKKFDGMVITGAPVENLDFDEVFYWEEIKKVMDWGKTNVFSSMYICWGAQAALYHYYGITKHKMDDKTFGVFKHKLLNPKHRLVRGFDDNFNAPHSRHTTIYKKDIEKIKDLEILAESNEAGVFLIASKNGKRVFVSGHAEYDADTLAREYERDIAKGLKIDVPKNYYPNDDPSQTPFVSWRAHAHLLFNNWLNYFVYQETPYDITKI